MFANRAKRARGPLTQQWPMAVIHRARLLSSLFLFSPKSNTSPQPPTPHPFPHPPNLGIRCRPNLGYSRSFFKTLIDHPITVELKNDIKITGTLKSVDQYLNIKLDDISVQEELKYPHLSAVKNVFIRGSVVRYVHLPSSAVDVTLLEDAARRGTYLFYSPFGCVLEGGGVLFLAARERKESCPRVDRERSGPPAEDEYESGEDADVCAEAANQAAKAK